MKSFTALSIFLPLFTSSALAGPPPSSPEGDWPTWEKAVTYTKVSTYTDLTTSVYTSVYTDISTYTDVSTSVFTTIYTSLSMVTTVSTETATATETVSASTSSAAVPTIYMAGDSTMALGGGGNGTQGWGQYLQYSFDTSSAFVINDAIAGRSARSYTREGSFAAIAEVIKPGDWVIIEFGHNDGGSPLPSSQDNGRADCPGFGNQTCVTFYDNVTEIVQTYPTYLKEASSVFLAEGAKVIISSPTGDDPWATGNYSYAPNRFTYFAWLAVSELGGPEAGVYFVDHGSYAAQAWYNLGPTIVNANYPLDHTHTAPYLASVVAQSFVLGLKCGTSPLADLVANATARIEGPILGTCIPTNTTVPI